MCEVMLTGVNPIGLGVNPIGRSCVLKSQALVISESKQCFSSACRSAAKNTRCTRTACLAF